MRFSQRRSHDQTLEWAEKAEDENLDHYMGITGRSVFFDAENFDVVWDMMPEPMHLIDGGFVKNTLGRTFNSGASHQTRLGYRRSPSAHLSELIRYCLLYTSPSPRDKRQSRMPSSA